MSDYNLCLYDIDSTIQKVQNLEKYIGDDIRDLDRNTGWGKPLTKGYRWTIIIKPKLLAFLGIICAVLSISIVIGEVTMDLRPESNFILKRVFVDFLRSGLTVNLLFLVLMGYFVYAIYYGLFNIRFFSIFALHPHQHTDGYSLVLSGTILARLVPPLCYNFLHLMRIQGTVFQ